MALDREMRDILPFDLAAGEGIWDSRRVDDPRVIRYSLALGAALALLLATGVGGLVPHFDWGLAAFCGIAAAIIVRGALLTRHHLAHGGWQAWRRRETDEAAIDRFALGGGAALAFLLATGGGGVGPAFALGEALAIGTVAGIVVRAILTFVKWP